MNLGHNAKRDKRISGLTIIEAAMATAVLVLCTAALFVSLHMSFTIANDVRENMLASSIIQEEIEELRKGFFANVEDPSDPPDFSNDRLASLANSSGTIIVQQFGDDDIVRVTVIVSWRNQLKPAKQNTKSIATLIARNGIHAL